MRLYLDIYYDGSMSIGGSWDEYVIMDSLIRRINHDKSHRALNINKNKPCKTQRESVEQMKKRFKANGIKVVSTSRMTAEAPGYIRITTEKN